MSYLWHGSLTSPWIWGLLLSKILEYLCLNLTLSSRAIYGLVEEQVDESSSGTARQKEMEMQN